MLRKLASGDKDDVEEDGEVAGDDTYMKFWNEFGRSIKMGVMEDAPNRAKLAKLLRFKTSKEETLTSLEAYVERMPEWQKVIYFLAGESEEAVKKSPFLEAALKKGAEVLYLTEPIDEYVMQHLGDFDGTKFQSLAKEGVKFGDEDEEITKKRTKLYKESFKPLTEFLKTLFAGKVSKVTVSQRVETSPAVVVTSMYGQSANMERIMKAQTFANNDRMREMGSQKTLELNPRHPIVIELNSLVQESPDDQGTTDLAWLLFDTSLVSSGFVQEDPDEFSDRMYRTIGTALNVKSMDLAPELEVELDEPDDDADADAEDGDSEL